MSVELFNDPTTLPEAVKTLLARDLLPTDMDTGGIRELDASLRNQSFFSAQTTNQYLLQLYRDRIAGILHPVVQDGGATTQFSDAYVRRDIKQFLKQVGYQPEPGEEGTLKDLSSDARINLVIRTNVELAQGQGNWMQSQNHGVLTAFPADELFRLEYRHVPRYWLMRWRMAGSATGRPLNDGWTITPDNRMIALKNHPIWMWIGSSKLFPDALDVLWPPFAFNSGMWVRDVDRNETMKIGLLKPGQNVPPMSLVDVFQKIESLLKPQ